MNVYEIHLGDKKVNSDTVSVVWGLIFFISNKLPGDFETDVSLTTLWVARP